MDLWKVKHESGQWVEIEATETRPEFSSLHASGIIFPGDIGKQKELGMVRPVSLGTESNQKDGANAVDINAGQNKGRLRSFFFQKEKVNNSGQLIRYIFWRMNQSHDLHHPKL